MARKPEGQPAVRACDSEGVGSKRPALTLQPGRISAYAAYRAAKPAVKARSPKEPETPAKIAAPDAVRHRGQVSPHFEAVPVPEDRPRASRTFMKQMGRLTGHSQTVISEVLGAIPDAANETLVAHGKVRVANVALSLKQVKAKKACAKFHFLCLLYTSPSPRDS